MAAKKSDANGARYGCSDILYSSCQILASFRVFRNPLGENFSLTY